jgi:hypothetical protein
MTPQQIEALKLALGALGRLVASIENPPDCGIRYVIDDAKEAVTALEEALAEHAIREVQRLGQEIEQEPAGWEVGVVDGVVTRRLAPPQRKPLTVAQIFACENSVPDEIVSDRVWCIYFARAIEAAHDIKENT